MLKINLVPEAKQQQKKIQKMNLTVTSAFIITASLILLILITIMVIRISNLSQNKKLKTSINGTEEELVLYKDLEETVVSLKKGLDGVKEITSKSSKWSKFFSELEKATPQDVSFKNLNIKDTEITATLTGKNIDSLARFIESFQSYTVKEKNLFVNLDVTGYTKEENNKVNFDAKFSFVKEVLWP